MNVFAESAAIHTLLHAESPMEIPSFQTSLMPVVDVVHVERRGFESWRDGDADAAISAFADAAATWADRSFVRNAARCSLTAGELAGRAGDGQLARQHLSSATDLAGRWELAPVLTGAQRALGELERSRHRLQLSRREVEVLELVAAGRTATQIASELGVGESTVVTHINSARLKLGARTRDAGRLDDRRRATMRRRPTICFVSEDPTLSLAHGTPIDQVPAQPYALECTVSAVVDSPAAAAAVLRALARGAGAVVQLRLEDSSEFVEATRRLADHRPPAASGARPPTRRSCSTCSPPDTRWVDAAARLAMSPRTAHRRLGAARGCSVRPATPKRSPSSANESDGQAMFTITCLTRV